MPATTVLVHRSCTTWVCGRCACSRTTRRKRTGLVGYGLEIVENIPIEIAANVHNHGYLLTKKRKLGHHLGLEE